MPRQKYQNEGLIPRLFTLVRHTNVSVVHKTVQSQNYPFPLGFWLGLGLGLELELVNKIEKILLEKH